MNSFFYDDGHVLILKGVLFRLSHVLKEELVNALGLHAVLESWVADTFKVELDLDIEDMLNIAINLVLELDSIVEEVLLGCTMRSCDLVVLRLYSYLI